MMDVAAPNEWTQQIDGGMLNSNMTRGGVLAAPSPATAAASAAVGAMGATGLNSTNTATRATTERPAGPQDGGLPLRCPRCDSSNTKFCYYNNYSLSQPRHFCKACKRYWTRGGTLRNVPVGGGCRKNKRLKKPSTNANTSSSTSSTDTSMPSLPFLPNPSTTAVVSCGSSDLDFLLYSLANQTSDGNFHLPRNPYDLHRQFSTLGQCFPAPSTGEGYLPGLIKTTHIPVQAAPAASATSVPPLLDQYSSVFGSTTASLLTSTFKQQRQAQQPKSPIHTPSDLPPYTSFESPLSGVAMRPLTKDIKLELPDANVGMMSSRSVLEWQKILSSEQALETMATSESSFYWNMGTSALGGSVWPDPTSSIAPLI